MALAPALARDASPSSSPSPSPSPSPNPNPNPNPSPSLALSSILTLTRCVDAIFDQMQQRQASIGGDGTNLAFQLSVRYASIILGSDHMGDLLGSGSAELRIVRDAEAVGGVQLPGLTSQTLATPSAFHELLRKGRTRLAQQHKPPAPSSAI